MRNDQFIEVARPSQAEGVGRALQQAFRNDFDLPAEMRACLDRLERF